MHCGRNKLPTCGCLVRVLLMQNSLVSRRARVATVIAFATNGALPATLLARYAEVKEALAVDAGMFGLLVAGYMVGAAGAFHLPGVFLRRLGSRWVASLGTGWVALSLICAVAGVTLGQPVLFLVGLIFAGFGDAVVDVAQNAQGLRVQEEYGRSLLSSMHAGWSIGAATGGLLGLAAASAGVPLLTHLGVWGLICALAMLLAARAFLPDTAHQEQTQESAGPLRKRMLWLLAPLALVALAGISVEDIGNNWSAVLLSTERGVAISSAGIGLSVLLVAQFVGRMVGDRFIDVAGRKPALITSLTLVISGLIITAWAPWASLTVAGLALAGLGCAITVPLAFAGADALPGFRPHAAVTWVNWIMRATTIALTPAIGGITALSSLPLAITVIALIAVVALAVQTRPSRGGSEKIAS